MKIQIMKTVACAAFSMTLSLVARAAVLPGPGGTWTIAAGDEQTITESEMAAYNALAKVVVNGTLTFADVTTAPAVEMEGSGACKKTGDADWTLSTACSKYLGSWDFAGGTIVGTVATAFGNYDSRNTDDTAVHIRSGATLKLSTVHTSGYMFLYKRFFIAGTGKNGQGAILVDVSDTKDGYIGAIALEADATINVPTGKRVNFQYGSIRLQSHTLTFTGGERIYFTDSEKFVGPGEVVMDTNVKFDFTKHTGGFADSTPRLKLTAMGGNEIRLIEQSKVCPWPEQYADLDITGTFTLIHSHMSVSSTPVNHWSELVNTWVGDVSLPTATDQLILSCDQTAKHCLFALKGNVSGLGSVQTFKATGDGFARIAYEGTNTFSGAMSAYLTNGGAVLLGNSNSVPDYAKFTANAGGRVTLRLADDGSRWCTNSIARFVNAATLSATTLIGIDASSSENGEATLDAAFWKDVKGGSQPKLVADGGTVVLKGPLSDKYYSVGALDGTLEITGDEPICLGESFAHSGLNGQSAGTLLFDGASDVHLGLTANDYGRILLPGLPSFWSSMNTDAVGRMTVRNSKIVGDTLATMPNDNAKSAIWVGVAHGSVSVPGILEVEEGANVQTKVLAGTTAKDKGAIRQAGGVLANVGNNDATGAPLLASAGYAGQELSGGVYEQQGQTENAKSTSAEFVLRQSGGLYSVTNHVCDAGNGVCLKTGNGRADFYVGGGEMRNEGTYAFIVDTGTTGSTVFTVDGTDTKVYGKSYMAYGASGKGGTFILNLNGGLLDLDYFTKYQASTTCKAYLNAGGGTIQIRKSGNNPPVADRITLYPGGFTFRDVGQNVTMTIPLEAPTGLGVSAVPVPAELSSAVLVGPPLVAIAETGTDGQGFGASAIALFDKTTGKVTGVQVTCPGRDYTEATATFHYADQSWTAVCSLTENSTAGGFTKDGPGQLYFETPNTYGGPTVVKQGGLSAKCDWAIPSNTVLRLEGGNIGLGATACAFKSIGGTGGNVGFSGAKTFTVETLIPGTTDAVKFNNSTMKVTGETRFDVAKVLAGETTTYGTDITFDEGSTIALDNVALLAGDDADKASPITLMTVPSGKQISGVPTWTNRPADGEWKMKVTLTSVKLVKQRGMLMIVR